MFTNISSTGRLSKDNYKRTKKTITDTFQNQKSIQNKLKDYKELDVDELDNTPIKSHLRYIIYSPQQKKELFRMGGILTVRHPKYVVLAGKNRKTFSVQRYISLNNGETKTTRFFRKLRKNEKVEDELEDLKERSEEVFAKQNKIISNQSSEIKKLQRLLKKMGKKK